MVLIGALVMLLTSSTLYRIMETETAVKLRFGELVVVLDHGKGFKALPFGRR